MAGLVRQALSVGYSMQLPIHAVTDLPHSALNTATLTPRRMGSHTSLDLRQSLGTRLAPATVLVLKFE